MTTADSVPAESAAGDTTAGMAAAKRHMVIGAGILGLLTLLYQGWALLTVYGNQERVFYYAQPQLTLTGVAAMLYVGVVVAAATGALGGFAVALARTSTYAKWIVAGALAGAATALAVAVTYLIPFDSAVLPWGQLALLLLPGVITNACLGAAVVALYWHCRTVRAQRWLLTGAAVGLGLAVMMFVAELLGYSLRWGRVTPFQFSFTSDMISLLTEMVTWAVLGALVGGALGLVGKSRGSTWMAIGAVLGAVAAILPAFVWSMVGVSPEMGGAADVWRLLRGAGSQMLVYGCIVASAAGLLWYASRVAQQARETRFLAELDS